LEAPLVNEGQFSGNKHEYEEVPLSELRRGRRGKHHEIIISILKRLEAVSPRSAVKIPLSSAKGVSLANLRAAVTRAATARGLCVQTYSDGENLYVWKAQPSSKKKR
jgi:hypothetical protein